VGVPAAGLRVLKLDGGGGAVRVPHAHPSGDIMESTVHPSPVQLAPNTRTTHTPPPYHPHTTLMQRSRRPRIILTPVVVSQVKLGLTPVPLFLAPLPFPSLPPSTTPNPPSLPLPSLCSLQVRVRLRKLMQQQPGLAVSEGEGVGGSARESGGSEQGERGPGGQ